MENILELKEVRVKYDTAEALKGITLSVPFKSITTLIGANGAGKTTTLNAISGLVDLSSGEIWLGKERIDLVEPHKRVERGIAHCPEGRRVFAYMSVLDNLRTGAHLRRDYSKTRSDLDMVFSHFPRLHERSKQKAGSLSGGEQQMLAIGRALMSAPKIILLDEPTIGLSPLLAKEVLAIVRNISKNNQVSTLLIEQNAQMALRMADLGYVLETGSIALVDKAENLLNSDHVKRAYLGG